jgi:hypothetical protein
LHLVGLGLRCLADIVMGDDPPVAVVVLAPNRPPLRHISMVLGLRNPYR